jgi:glyoxylase-like metal-dependent hydrolase (beta-lactamase superfamily II)
MCVDEWDYYTGAAYLSENPDRAPLIQKHLMALQGQVKRIACDGEIVPGIRFVSAPGHSLHHAAVLIESAGETLVYAADAYAHPLHVQYPAWHFFIDVDKAQSAQSRSKLAQLAADSAALVLSYHFPFPGLGHIVADGDDYVWRTLAP